MAEIKRIVFGAEDLQKSLDEIRFFLNLPDGPSTTEEIAEFRRFKLFAESGPYVRLMKLAKGIPIELWEGIGTDHDLPAIVDKDEKDQAKINQAVLRANMIKIVKRWTMTKVWEQHPPEQSFQMRFLSDDVVNQPTVHRTKKTPRAKKDTQEAISNG